MKTKTVEIVITEARSIEDAMERAVMQARDEPGHQLLKVTFKSLDVAIDYRENLWSYVFEALLERLER